MSEFDELCDRVTSEDLEVFARLKVWTAAQQVEDHINDASIMWSLTDMPGKNKKARHRRKACITITAHGGQDL